MKRHHLSACVVVLLSACASVSEQSVSTIIVDGVSYDLRTRTIESPRGSFVQNSVIVGNVPVTCLPDSPNDCQAAVRRQLARFDRATT